MILELDGHLKQQRLPKFNSIRDTSSLLVIISLGTTRDFSRIKIKGVRMRVLNVDRSTRAYSNFVTCTGTHTRTTVVHNNTAREMTKSLCCARKC